MQPTESKIVLKLPQYNQIQFSLVISAVQFMYRIQLQFIDNSNNQYRFYKASLMSAAFPPLPSFVQTEQKCCCTTLNSIKAFCGYNCTSESFSFLEIWRFQFKSFSESLQSYVGEALPALQDNFIKDLQESQRDLENFYRMVETTIDLDEVKRGSFLIKPSFDENLQELREMLDDLEAKLQQCRER